MDKQFIHFLENKAYNLRVNSILETTQAESGHATSALSAADIVAVCFFYAMHFDPKNLSNPNNDRFVLSKGHAAAVLYAVWKELGVISQEELMTYRHVPLVGCYRKIKIVMLQSIRLTVLTIAAASISSQAMS